MATDRPSADELRHCLRLLAQDLGIWRPNLISLLSGGLSPLQQVWGVGLNDLDLARKTIALNLQWHLEHLTPRSSPSRPFYDEVRKQQYLVAVAIGFNMHPFHGWQEKKILERREWQAKDAPGLLRISVSTSQRYFDDAVDQIVAHLTSDDYKPVVPLAAAEADSSWMLTSTLLASGSVVNKGRPAPEERSHRRLPIWAVAAATVLALIVALVFYAPKILTGVISGAANSATTTPSGSAPASSTPASTVRAPTTSPAAQPQPFHIDRIAEVHTVPQGYTYAFPRKLDLTTADLASLNGLNAEWAEYNQWMKAKGGVPSFDGAVQVVLRGTLPQTVVISDIRINKQCGPYLKGALMYSPPAGQDDSVEIGFDLDKQLSVAQNYRGGELSGTYFTSHSISLKQGETLTLVMHARTNRQHCKYHFEVVATTGESDEPIVVKIDNKGKKFEVTATADVQNEGANNTVAKFTDYQEVYAGGVTSPDGWKRVGNPATFRGDCSVDC